MIYIYTSIPEFFHQRFHSHSGCLVMALRSMDRKKEALSEAEKALEAAEELTKGHAAGSPVPL